MGWFHRSGSVEGSLKQVIVVRADLRLPKGKLAAQVAHASVEAVLRSAHELVQSWRAEGMKKVVVKVADETALLEVQRLAKKKGLVTSLITDAGKTIVAPGTRTCVGIGPASEEQVDAVTGNLSLL